MEQIFDLKDRRDFPVEMPKGYYMCLTFTTQAANRVNIKLYDECKAYLDETRQSTNPEPIITKSGRIEGDNLSMHIDIPLSSRVEVRKNKWDITGANGELIARTIVLLVEDSYDYDYNDVIVTITAWKNNG